MSSRSPADEEEAAIRALVQSLTQAIRAKDIGRVMSSFADEVVSFDFGPPLQHGGGDAFVQRWRELFHAYRGEIDYEVTALEVAVGDRVAFSHSLNRIGGTLQDGQSAERWLRWTACYRKVGGQWRIMHEHVSVPADLRTGRAILDLRP